MPAAAMPRSTASETAQVAKVKRSKLATIVSGAASGMMVSACVQPLDVLRTRMQADAAKGVFLNTVQALQTVVKEGGVSALWRGTQATVLRLGMGAGLHFFFLESLKPLLEQTQPDGRKRMTVAGAAIAGGVARGLAAIVSCPITVVKTQMEYTGAGAPQYTGTAHALASITRERGLRGLFSGVGPTLLANAPFSAIYYVFYTQLQERLRERQWPSFGVNFASGTVAAVAATLITQPADVVRTRMQLGLHLTGGAAGAAGAAAAVARPTSLEVLRQVLSGQGARGLMAGAVPRIVKRTFQTALVWAIYEELMPVLTHAAAWAGQQMRQQRGGGGGFGSGGGGGVGGSVLGGGLQPSSGSSGSDSDGERPFDAAPQRQFKQQ